MWSAMVSEAIAYVVKLWGQSKVDCPSSSYLFFFICSFGIFRRIPGFTSVTPLCICR